MKDFKTRREKEKEQREAEIVAAAETLFYQKGFESTSMDEIAKEAQFTKRTVYQYFSSKEELYLAVALKCFCQLMSYFEKALAKGRTGMEKFRLSSMAYYQFYQDQPAGFHILNHCNYIEADHKSSPSFQTMMNLKQKMVRMFSEAIEAGKKDGTIRSDFDSVMGVYAGVFLSSGFLNILSQTGANFSQKNGIDQDQFVRFSLDLICRALQK